MKPRFLFINTRKAQCSIYKSGVQVYNALRGSENWTLDYVEIPDINKDALYRGEIIIQGEKKPDYDVLIFNYHDITMRGMEGFYSENFHNLPGTRLSVILEVEPNNPYSRLFSDDFHGYLVLDPTLEFPDQRFHAFPRPIVPYQATPQHHDVPVIGSFGFATQDKYFDRIVAAVSAEFDRAVVRINIPVATYADPQDLAFNQIKDQCLSLAKPGIDVVFTRDFMDDQQLIDWCAENSLNCFFYDRNMPGLAAVTDQAIASGAPLAVSDCNTFRHIHRYLAPYPAMDLKTAMAESQLAVKQMQQDWSWQACQQRLTEILFEDD